MNEHTDNDLQAELAALRQRLNNLEAEHRELKRQATRTRRPAFSRKFLLNALPIALLLAAVGVLYATDAMFIDKNGNVGIGTSTPSSMLDVAGKLNVADTATFQKDATINGGLTVNGTGNSSFAGNVGIGTTSPVSKLTINQKIGDDNNFPNYNDAPLTIFEPTDNGGVTPKATRDILHLVRAGVSYKVYGNKVSLALGRYENAGVNSRTQLDIKLTDGNFDNHNAVMSLRSNGNVGIGTTSPEAKLDVVGDARIQGKVHSLGRYQKNDDAETTYQLSPRYHLSLTGETYFGKTKSIPQDVLEDLCGDQDGCEFRLAMTRWDSDVETESASRSGLLYYSKSDGRWRASFDAADSWGVDGNGTNERVIDIWDTCIFMDGNYSKQSNLGDLDKGMQVLVWDNSSHNSNQNRTCELTLID